jgi:glycosyltransferase involved in cell wall biosynthesis
MDLSIVIPTYNRVSILPNVLDSVRRARGPKSFEIIICDDGSTQDVSGSLDQCARDLPIVYLRQERRGARRASARNLGLRAARGDVILFIDDDVVFSRDFISEHMKAHASTSQPKLVFGFRHRVTSLPGGKDHLPLLVGVPNDHRVDFIGPRGQQLPSHATPWFYCYSCNFSTSGRQRDITFDESFVEWGYEDLDFAYQYWKSGAQIICAPDAVVLHLDQSEISDPYENRKRGLPAAFTPVITNIVRMLVKYPNDTDLQAALRGCLLNFSLIDGDYVSNRGAAAVDEIIEWVKQNRLRPATK